MQTFDEYLSIYSLGFNYGKLLQYLYQWLVFPKDEVMFNLKCLTIGIEFLKDEVQFPQ